MWEAGSMAGRLQYLNGLPNASATHLTHLVCTVVNVPECWGAGEEMEVKFNISQLPKKRDTSCYYNHLKMTPQRLVLLGLR